MRLRFTSLPFASASRLRRFPFICLLLVASANCVRAHAATCDVRKFGAKADGVTVNTVVIQKAIDSCVKKRGTVVVEGGVFVTGPLELKSHVTLRVAKGATLLGSPNHADFAPRMELRYKALTPLLSATNAEDIAIVGEGTIDGNGASWWAEARAQGDHGIIGEGYLRPRGIVFDHCKHIRMEGVTVQNSAFWQIVPYYTDDISFKNMKVLADPRSPNTDGIDPFSSSHVVIDHLLIDVGDDNVAIKSGAINSPGPDEPSHDITVTHCVFLHGHGISIGSELAGGANHIAVSDIQFKGTDNGVRVKSYRDRGHDIGFISFRNITMEDVKTPVLISAYYPKTQAPEGDVAQPLTRLTPYFHDITIENLTAKGGNLAVIIGLPESPVKNVVLKNVSIATKLGMIIANAEVTGENVHVTAAEGEGIQKQAGAKVSLK